jgi:hypothetical protein
VRLEKEELRERIREAVEEVDPALAENTVLVGILADEMYAYFVDSSLEEDEDGRWEDVDT